ncbi:hypothetical protein DMUE_2920 [Dictyocoela muelleri]|nr:hypothetical protein DMUE_2920 [Dictyocoela muelleri]
MLFRIFLMITLCLTEEYMKLKGIKKNNQKKLNKKKKSLRGNKKMDYLDLWTSYYSHKNCNNILKNEINKPIIKLDEKSKFECKDKSCQNKNCNNYHLDISNKCDWNNLNEDEGYKYKPCDWNGNKDFESVNCDFGAGHVNNDDIIDNNSKCSCTECCYLNENYCNQNLNNQNYCNQNYCNQNYCNQNRDNQNLINENRDNQNLDNQTLKNENYCNQNYNNENYCNKNYKNQYSDNQNTYNQYSDNQNTYNQYSDNPCLNNCSELSDIKTIITKPDNSLSSYQPDENVFTNQKEICEDVINLPQTNSIPNNSSTESEMVNKDTPYNNFKYESVFNTIDNNNKINKSEEIKHFNQDCKKYYQNTTDPPNNTISKPNGYFYEIKNNNEINPSLNEDKQNIKYDDLGNYDLKMKPENKNNDQNNNQAIEANDGKGSLNKDSKSKINGNQRNNKKKSDSDKKENNGGKKNNSKNNCMSYIST